jgi:fibro-slime domain-containing protein
VIKGLALVLATLVLVCTGCARKGVVVEATPSAQATESVTPAATSTAALASPVASPLSSAVTPAATSTAALASPVASPLPSGTPTPEATQIGQRSSAPPFLGKVLGSSLIAYYYELPEKHPDVNKDIDNTIVTGLVETKLGPDGFPVATSFARTAKIASGPISDVNAAGEIMWWSAASMHGVKVDKTGVDKLPLDNRAMYPTGYTNDNTYFRTARWHGTFTLAKATDFTMTLGSDDDSWVFIDGMLAVDNGGVKAFEMTPFVVRKLSSGAHTIDIFYADRHSTQAQIYFNSQQPLHAQAQPVKQITKIETVKKGCTERLTLGADTLFAFDEATLAPTAQKTLKLLGPTIKKTGTHLVHIFGYTDSIGSDSYNQPLSERRARAVRDWLAAHGYVKSSTTIQGFGKQHPIAPNVNSNGSDNPQGRAKNRRVEVLINTCK